VDEEKSEVKKVKGSEYRRKTGKREVKKIQGSTCGDESAKIGSKKNKRKLQGLIQTITS